MSNQSNIGSVTDKQKIEEDKCGLYDSSTIDSGFISGEIFSSELTDSGIIEDKKKVGYNSRAITDSVIDEYRIQGDPKEGKDSIQDDPKESVSMFLDSGVCLSENLPNLSKLSISQGFNDLDAPLKPKFVDSISSVKEPKQPTKEAADIPLKIFYEQDEDGDT